MLMIEYRLPTDAVSDYADWKDVFDTDPVGRKSHGATRHAIHRDRGDKNHFILTMEFGTVEEAESFLNEPMLRQSWRSRERGGRCSWKSPRRSPIESRDRPVAPGASFDAEVRVFWDHILETFRNRVERTSPHEPCLQPGGHDVSYPFVVFHYPRPEHRAQLLFRDRPSLVMDPIWTRSEWPGVCPLTRDFTRVDVCFVL
jgi:hypothetical protein